MSNQAATLALATKRQIISTLYDMQNFATHMRDEIELHSGFEFTEELEDRMMGLVASGIALTSQWNYLQGIVGGTPGDQGGHR